ncbi:MAG TPA: biotin transporter BioY [Alphaproteobacteria bacterium]|nr:biotin transporter BioY [Alphaproteobacteria bacterium]
MKTALSTARIPTLFATFWPGAGIARAVVMVLGGSLLLALSAKVQVPFWPVPMTMQSLVVLLLGMSYGSRLGAATLAAYLAEGICGLPVFAGATAGPAYMMGPTAGYLVGFLLAAALLGWLAEHGWGRGVVRLAVAMSIGHVLLFVPGVLWLAVLLGWGKAIAVGVTPFIAATVLKTALGVAVMSALWGLAGRRGGSQSLGR